ncbi:MAG: RNA polymerase sporulation sigma factor SigK [Christensenellaceae bacterium]|jgi:RNA polymerase sporulation-specific sigma factor|nr:RNA polymerase sporulation sigma factor SigK [Christensenellaceae bacterium]
MNKFNFKAKLLSLVDIIKNLIRQYFKDVNSIDYMISLPNPLEPDEEAKMIALNETGDNKARNILIEHNLRLVVYIAKRFDNTGMDIEELISVGTWGLIKAVKSYNSEKKIKLATYASRCIENEILMFLRKMVRIKTEVSIDAPINADNDGHKLLLSDVLGSEADQIYLDFELNDETNTLRELFSTLDKRDKKIICLRYGLFGVEEKTQKEIADEMQISQSYISRLEKRIIEKLRNDFNKKTTPSIDI